MTTHTAGPAKAVTRPGDRIFAGLSLGSGWAILAILAGVATFLIWQALPAVTASPKDVRGGHGLIAYIAPLLFGTIVSATIAVLIAVPLSVGISLFISHYAPRRLAVFLGYLIDLLAAVPSLVYGLWGLSVLAPATVPLGMWLGKNFGWIPFFAGTPSATGRTMFTVGVVLAVMILPIMTATMREIFLQTPRLHEEAALALGATRWEMIRMAVFPFGRSGMVSATMLGLGRALGETMAVAMILSPSVDYTARILTSSNPGTIAADIALNFPEVSGLDSNTLVAAGLALFALTLTVNTFARWVVSRKSKFSGAN
ncbi:phosphate ABC transporter permease subunit PstC [Dermatophilus congolensis]|uniref:phosphate ABC transporter permease subunit PstC n=1 Tax=Dermatophilus congolensis TaxID=1863 RepID=UPI001AAEDBD3|nr:phosphate ABC transporter permease subunit PstC [Dermatophilus congolensis]MBO3132733.1 phosphate ABC transporter permease subunit PstC [Dermatophilus congolensis]MBO3133105.1 phosphate ABC transporter permease subunit PstC [Dermatophilus congolensis]MBO3135339.1 phosphate ABC transporter permease subunit PstC [Dermatophilus congolensis]MBO3137581.1 phosphate ABC transporter permease subunit PstC [Dermatophilus congolensis]